MAAIPKHATILDCCHVTPPADARTPAAQTLPLTFFDVTWIHLNPVQRVLFYQIPCSKTHFLESIVPNFKKCLSETLRYFLPLAGNLVYPLNSGFPEFRYVSGDSVSVTVAEANEASDFSYLTGNHPRDADEFYAYLSDLSEPKVEPEFKLYQLLAVQLTLFPDIGICVGLTSSHVAGDESTMVQFLRAWSSVASKVGADDEYLAANNLLPFCDKSVIKDPSDLKTTFWNGKKLMRINNHSQHSNLPTGRHRGTFILQKNDIQKLKTFVQAKKPDITHVSSFTVTTAYVWTCLAKSAGEEVVDEEPEYFFFSMDARSRLDPPVPGAYFGNCLGLRIVESTHLELKGELGLLAAAALIGEAISETANDKDEILRDVEHWGSKIWALRSKRHVGVTGSPRFDLYDVDFGWGKPVKFEYVDIDGHECMSIGKSREFEGGLEICLSLPKRKLDAFAAVFFDGLNN